MGLTKPRAAQIFNLDYKQSTRVVTTTNITLTGGAPTPVDSVNLSVGDRVLVTGQSTGSQNGLYQVQTVGSGANGTWVRTSDGNETGEIEAGMIVMVTEGTIYADTQWKLITDDPITLGTTALTFTQNYSANSISSGTSNVVINSNANVTVSSAGTANVLTVSNTGAFVSGVVSATGNITGNYILGNGALLTGVSTTSSNINNGTSNVTVVSSGGNVTVGIGGTGNVAVFSTSGLDVTGRISATGNITGGNIVSGGGVGGNITGANVISGNTFNATTVSATGNITGNYILGNGALLTGVSTTSSNINNGTSNVTVVSSGGNVTVGIGGTGNVAVFSTSGLDVTGRISATGNITGGNIVSGGGVGGNITGANVISGNTFNAVTVSASGNIATGNLNITGNIVDTGPISIITTSNGNISLAPNGTGNVNITGNVMPTANATSNIGSAALSFNTIFAQATSAQYADLAEMYVADADYTPGTVLDFGGSEEVTATTTSHSVRIAGIVSTNPSYLMNSTLSCTNAVKVALVGRVPCQVVGTIAKGDRLVASSTPGVATRLDMAQYQPGCIVCKALETYDSETVGTIEVAVGRT